MARRTPAELAYLSAIARANPQQRLIDVAQALDIPLDLVRLNQAAILAGCTRCFVRKRIRDGSIPAFKVASRWIVSLSALIHRAAQGGKGSGKPRPIPTPPHPPRRPIPTIHP